MDWLRLIRSSRVGPVTFLRLLRQFGSAGKALEALPDIASEAGVSKYQMMPLEHVREEIRSAKALGARLIFLGTKDYPNQLLDLPDPPPALWSLGDPELLKRPIIALVGARNASAIGKRMATKLAKDLGELGYVVVSKLQNMALGFRKCPWDWPLKPVISHVATESSQVCPKPS